MPRLARLYFLVFCSLLVGYFFYFTYLLGATPFPPGELRTVMIAPGEGIGDISRALAEESLIRSPRAFAFLGFITGTAHRLRPGRYVFTGEERASDILQLLASGPPLATVLVPEGSTLLEIDALLSRAGVLEEGSLSSFPIAALKESYGFLKEAETLEGYLFPDTYVFEAGSVPETVARKFLDTFEAKALPILEEAGAAGSALFSEALVLASLLEKEVVSWEDRRIVAGILRKRISLRMPLQVDATVIYAKCGAFKGCSPLRREDFSLASPLNTYEIQGLPPSAIGNPGSMAMKASVSPEASPYLYYLSDPKTGKTHFSTTFEEHNIKRARYLSL